MSRFRAQTTEIFDEELADLSRDQVKRLTVCIDLGDVEIEQLAKIFGRDSSPPPALRKALSRLGDPKRQPPQLHWTEPEA